MGRREIDEMERDGQIWKYGGKKKTRRLPEEGRRLKRGRRKRKGGIGREREKKERERGKGRGKEDESGA